MVRWKINCGTVSTGWCFRHSLLWPFEFLSKLKTSCSSIGQHGIAMPIPEIYAARMLWCNNEENIGFTETMSHNKWCNFSSLCTLHKYWILQKDWLLHIANTTLQHLNLPEDPWRPESNQETRYSRDSLVPLDPGYRPTSPTSLCGVFDQTAHIFSPSPNSLHLGAFEG